MLKTFADGHQTDAICVVLLTIVAPVDGYRSRPHSANFFFFYGYVPRSMHIALSADVFFFSPILLFINDDEDCKFL